MDEIVFDIAFLGGTYQGFYIKNPDTAANILSKLMLKDCLFGFDTETAALPKYKSNPDAALSPHLSQIRLLQVFDGTNSFVFDCYHIPIGTFTRFLQSKRFVAHNALFDLSFIRKAGIENCNIGCTMLAWIILYHALFAEDDGFSAKLVDVTHNLLGTDILKHMQRSDWSVPELTYEQILYAGVDAICVLKIAEKLSKGLEKHGLINYYNLCKRALHPISEIQLNGVKLDVEHHKESVAKWRDELVVAKKEMLALTGLKDITAHTLAKWLEENLPPETLAIWPRTEKGKLKTDSHAFSDFSYLPIVSPFAAYQKKQTLCSTFGSNLFEYINQASGRIHPSYFICGARTGRLSSRRPNGQNMPAREKTVRESFIAEPGNVLVVADYGQVELRCAAEISQDQTMLKAYRDGIDLHRLTASKVSRKKLEDVTDDDRQMAKAINFGLLFGLSAKGFSHYAKKSYGVDISERDSNEAVQIFRDAYPTYREWQLNQANSVGISKRCVTPMGKWRTLPDDSCWGNAMNHPIQGAAAEIMLSALIRIFIDQPTGIRLVNTVHDEIVLECKVIHVPFTARLLREAMIAGYLDVFPNGITRDLVEVGAGLNWADAKSKKNRIDFNEPKVYNTKHEVNNQEALQ